MSVIATDKWLQADYDNPILLCSRITKYFNNVSAHELYQHLKLHGMYQPTPHGKVQVETLLENDVWNTLNKEFQLLQQEWDGPDIPIYIFPSDSTNDELKEIFQGKSGLSFKDKLFLFVSEGNTEKELQALFTHEYNHVCRLTKWKKNEKDYVLLDTIILEGIAENSVLERMGVEYVGSWASYYSESDLNEIWNDLIFPNRNISKSDFLHHMLLYGIDEFPKMGGYCVGNYLVKKFLKEFNISSKDVLSMETNTIAQLNKHKQ
ncbi:DUF2268 domain-containing protein [Ornithinibacillus sp. 179-J 7C1 HS]|uniref:DUF2268 domain-containing protein n=1 Tax=Ornithinibacillus sp. 179-J 7C1 HS TaxID=3142384 RepID=UPI0039A30746